VLEPTWPTRSPKAPPSTPRSSETKAGFRLPDDPAVRGSSWSGLAPVWRRSAHFLQERARLQGGGRRRPWTGHACSSAAAIPDQDFLYREELEAIRQAEGICRPARRLLAPSTARRTYVQDLILQGARESLGRCWKAGARRCIVCGDGSRMEPDVKRELTRHVCGREGCRSGRGGRLDGAHGGRGPICARRLGRRLSATQDKDRPGLTQRRPDPAPD
jgi:hypothetical protein